MRAPLSAKQKEYGLGCLVLLVMAFAVLVALGRLAEDLAQTQGGKVAIAACFFTAILVFIGAFFLTPCRRTS